jgi:hypothetical protein
MRGIVALFALWVMSSSAALALSQENPKTAKKSVKTDSTAGNTATNPVLTREQTAFKEWAKAMRETADSAKKMTNRKQSERNGWLMRTSKTREDKIRAKYRVSAPQLYAMLRRGLVAKWPAETAEDLAIAKMILDPIIFEDDLKDWTLAHMPQRGDAREIALSGVYSEIRKRAPITTCGAKLSDDGKCPRKLIGERGQLCYEHRQSAGNSD